MAKDIKMLKWDQSEKFVSINIVPDHFKDNALYELLESLMNHYEITQSTISLEITECMKIDNLPHLRACLDDFYKKGIDLKLDDAGTGYGGFSYIQELGISTYDLPLPSRTRSEHPSWLISPPTRTLKKPIEFEAGRSGVSSIE